MHKISFNKLFGKKEEEKKATCLFCHKNEIPIEKWNKRCDECREKQDKIDAEEQSRTIKVGTRMPAAVINPQDPQNPELTLDNTQVFVDKFGREVDNPGYDLNNDPRGWGYTGTKPKDKTLI